MILIRFLFPYVFIVALWNMVLYFLKHYNVAHFSQIPSTTLMACSMSLGMLLSTRVKIAYDRIIESKEHLAKLISHLKNVMRLAKNSCSQNDFHFIEQTIEGFCKEIKIKLQNYSVALTESSIHEMRHLELISKTVKKSSLSQYHVEVERELSQVNESLHQIFKIRLTRVPRYYDQVVSFLALVVCMAIPLTISNVYLSGSLSLVSIIIYQLVSFYNQRMESPFGQRKTDLDLDGMLSVFDLKQVSENLFGLHEDLFSNEQDKSLNIQSSQAG